MKYKARLVIFLVAILSLLVFGILFVELSTYSDSYEERPGYYDTKLGALQGHIEVNLLVCVSFSRYLIDFLLSEGIAYKCRFVRPPVFYTFAQTKIQNY